MPIFPMAFGAETVEVNLPEGTERLGMSEPRPLAHPRQAIAEALRKPIGSPGLDALVREKWANKGGAAGAGALQVAIVISDNTRPVPYAGESGILVPVVDLLLEAGVAAENITVIVATGTHRPLSEDELRRMIDPSLFGRPIRIENHDCRDRAGLAFLGTTSRGTKVLINKRYLESDLKILTGLVESHFMAGASGGRKSVCPGLLGEESTYVFHSAEFLSSPNARDLVLVGNPLHEEALEVAGMAGAAFIVNVTLNSRFEVTGVFAGDLEAAHEKAVSRLAEYVGIPIAKEYDIVVTHGGFVGINHYQAAKAGVAATPALKRGGRLVIAANDVDRDPVGSPLYRTLIHLLTLNGPDAFNRLIKSPDWRFIPEQWQVQMWTRVFAKTPMDNFTYCAPHFTPKDAAILPGRDGNLLLAPEERYSGSLAAAARMVELAVTDAVREYAARGVAPSIAYLQDGPYGVPMLRTTRS